MAHVTRLMLYTPTPFFSFIGTAGSVAGLMWECGSVVGMRLQYAVCDIM